jgi:hypothetical protein
LARNERPQLKINPNTHTHTLRKSGKLQIISTKFPSQGTLLKPPCPELLVLSALHVFWGPPGKAVLGMPCPGPPGRGGGA